MGWVLTGSDAVKSVDFVMISAQGSTSKEVIGSNPSLPCGFGFKSELGSIPGGWITGAGMSKERSRG